MQYVCSSKNTPVRRHKTISRTGDGANITNRILYLYKLSEIDTCARTALSYGMQQVAEKVRDPQSPKPVKADCAMVGRPGKKRKREEDQDEDFQKVG